MGKHNFENIKKQAYLLGNRNGGLGFDSPRLHHILKVLHHTLTKRPIDV
jgi:hypothetical protein